jgi:hypothetical protein
MCVHYAVAFTSCCQALGIPARCAALTGDLDGADGHFAAEVWLPECDKWALVDPNLDALFLEGSVPLSFPEVRALGDDLPARVEWGSGTPIQRRNPHLQRWLEESYLSGRCFRHRGLWHRADFLTRPEESPPGHGSTAYCELGLIWERADRDRGFGMFHFFGDDHDFEAPP